MSLNTYEDFEKWCTNTHHDTTLETSWDEYLRTSMVTGYLELEVRQLEQQMGMPFEKIGDAYQKLLKQDRRKGDNN